MPERGSATRIPSRSLPKAPTGIRGLDEVLEGGIPRGRTTLVAGSPGTGKTLLGIEFLVRGAREFGENGVIVSFEERPDEIVRNVSSLGFDLQGLIDARKVAIEHVRIERSEIEETGEYDLEGLFIRLDAAVRAIGAKRVVIDTMESLFAGLPNRLIVRAELRRLFTWLKDRRLTAVITGERGGESGLTREGLEEYVSDCVLLLDNRIVDQISTRRLRILKYRGSMHGANEYPFFIGDRGFVVAPVTSLTLDYPSFRNRVRTGIAGLDQMLENRGFFRGSTIIVSGTAGTGKTSIAGTMADSSCRRGDRVLYFSFEESPDQIVRNMESIGLRLKPWARKGLLRFHCLRPTWQGLERLLSMMHDEVAEFGPRFVVMDPINNLTTIGTRLDIQLMVTRLIDVLKKNGITAVFTSLTESGESLEKTSVDISSLADAWVLIRDMEIGAERVRGVYVLKSRGMANSPRIRQLRLTGRGVVIEDFSTLQGENLPTRALHA